MLHLAPVRLAFAAGALCLSLSAHAQFQVRVPYENAAPEPEASLQLTPSNLAFDGVTVGASDSQVVRLSNVGLGDATVALSTPEYPFSLSHNCPNPIGAKQNCDITVTFSPAEKQSFSSSVKIDDLTLTLSGSGVDPTFVDLVVGANGFAFVQRSDGAWFAAGWNGQGSLGLGNTTNRNKFTRVSALDGATQLRAAGHVFAKLADGRWYATGANSNLQLGIPDYNNRTSFTLISALDGATDVVVGNSHTIAKFSDGTWRGVGANSAGALGLGQYVGTASTFTHIPALDGATRLVSGPYSSSTFAQMSGGAWIASGDNSTSNLGLSYPTYVREFIPINDLLGAVDVIAGNRATFARTPDGWLAVGSNSYGTLLMPSGGGEDEEEEGGVSYVGSFTTPTLISQMDEVITAQTLTLVRVGANWHGIGSIMGQTYSTLTALPELTGARKVQTDLNGSLWVIKADGTLWAGGWNGSGQLGLGDLVTRSSLEKVTVE